MSVARDLPTLTSDSANAATPTRAGSYGEAYTLPISGKELFAADEGSYYTAITPTPGTGIIGHAAPTTFDEAKPYIVVYNAGSKRIYPQFLQLHCTVVGVGHTRVQMTVTVDDGNRRSSAGTAMTVANVNSGSALTTGAVATIGAVVGTAATAARRIHSHVVFRGTIEVVEDVFELNFGGAGSGSQTGSRVTTVGDFSRTVAPLVIAPGDSLCITLWAGSMSTGPTFQATLGWIER